LGFLFKKRTGITLKKVFNMLKETGKGFLELGITCGVAGIIIGTLSITGLGLSFSSFLVELAHGKKFLLFLLAAIGATILGMGMTVTAAYLLMVAMVAPALQEIGTSPLIAHFFVFYYGVLSFLTPPVCLACYAASPIAGARIWEIALKAMKLGIVAYIVPFIFAYKPSLLLKGDFVEIIEAFFFAVIGVYFLARGVEGYLFRPLGLIQRVILIISGIITMIPGYIFDIFGILISLPIIIYEWRKTKVKSI